MMNESVKVQRQAMQNAEDLQFYLRDLNQWQTEIKAKDRDLTLNACGTTQPVDIPPIRNISGKNRQKSKTKAAKTCSEKRIPSSDYKSWDKLNVDKLCEDVDKSSSDDVTDEDETEIEDEDKAEQAEIQRCKQQAVLEKEKGNNFIKVGKLNEAILSYSKGMLLDPENPILPANRALAFLKNEQFGAAEEDCNTALTLDPSYVKAYQRRAVARKALNKLYLARDDLLEVMKLEPKNKEANNELQKLEKEMEKAELKPSCEITTKKKNETGPKLGKIYPVNKPVELQSGKPLRRIRIEEIDERTTVDKHEIIRSINSKKTFVAPALPNTNALEPPDVPKAPTTSYQFQNEFRHLKAFPDILYRYIKQIPCVSYPKLFQNNLEPEIFSQLISIFHSHFMWADDDLYEPLYYLSRTQRFSTLKMFLTEKDKQVLHELFQYMRKVEMRSTNELGSLIQAYGI